MATCSRDLQSRPLRKMIEVVVQIREGRLGLSSDGRSRASGEPGRRCRLCCRVPGRDPPRSVAHLLPSEAEDERETNELADPPDFEPPPCPGK